MILLYSRAVFHGYKHHEALTHSSADGHKPLSRLAGINCAATERQIVGRRERNREMEGGDRE